MSSAQGVARLAVVKLLRARVVDIASVLQSSSRHEVQVLGAAQLTDSSRRAALMEMLSASPSSGNHREHFLIVPRAAAEEVFGAALAAPALEGSAVGRLLEDTTSSSPNAICQIPTDSVLNPLAAPPPTLSLGQVAAKLQEESSGRFLGRAAPAWAGSKRVPALSATANSLFDAVSHGSNELLLDALGECLDGEVNSASPIHGGTCLHIAAGTLKHDCAETFVAELCKAGADVNARALNGSTALHWAAGSGNAAAVHELLRQGADPSMDSYTWKSNVFGKASGQTAAHWAAESGHHDCLEALLAHGALTSFLGDERGKLPSDLAVHEGHDGVVALLQEAAQSEMICLAVSTEATAHKILPATFDSE
ncbi:unnamed protein product [Polarella glacialis]|uniref:Uncharacterized protein n=1 Tax=Polarella glacialis TaxID=89957 RepID=A0A813K4G2_POLGL|nr:unnamed protein product [Polarella glacialis]